MPKPKVNGSGDAYQSWNSDQPTATAKMNLPVAPGTLRPPVSDSATICCSSAEGFPASAAPNLLNPAFFLVVARGAFMQRHRQAVLHHVLGLEVRERRVELLELLEVVEHGLHHDVHRVGGHLGRR